MVLKLDEIVIMTGEKPFAVGFCYKVVTLKLLLKDDGLFFNDKITAKPSNTWIFSSENLTYNSK